MRVKGRRRVYAKIAIAAEAETLASVHSATRPSGEKILARNAATLAFGTNRFLLGTLDFGYRTGVAAVA
jgi:hypothetical protein